MPIPVDYARWHIPSYRGSKRIFVPNAYTRERCRRDLPSQGHHFGCVWVLFQDKIGPVSYTHLTLPTKA